MKLLEGQERLKVFHRFIVESYVTKNKGFTSNDQLKILEARVDLNGEV